MADRTQGCDVLLYHNAVPVVRAKANWSGADSLALVLGPIVFPRNTRIELEAVGAANGSLPAGRVAAIVTGFSRAGLQVRLESEDAPSKARVPSGAVVRMSR